MFMNGHDKKMPEKMNPDELKKRLEKLVMASGQPAHKQEYLIECIFDKSYKKKNKDFWGYQTIGTYIEERIKKNENIEKRFKENAPTNKTSIDRRIDTIREKVAKNKDLWFRFFIETTTNGVIPRFDHKDVYEKCISWLEEERDKAKSSLKKDKYIEIIDQIIKWRDGLFPSWTQHEKLSEEEIKERENVIQLLEKIIENHKYLRSIHSNYKTIAEKQYIPIQVTPERMYHHDIKTSYSYAETIEEIKGAYAFKGLYGDFLKNKTAWEKAREKYKKRGIMVIAEPGMGKSTLLMMESYNLARDGLEGLSTNENSVHDIVIPIIMRLKDLYKTKQEFYDAIPQLVMRDYSETTLDIENLIKKKINDKKCLILLDALDEVPLKRRKELGEKLNRFAQNYKCPIICTSRIVGYGKGFLNNAKEVEIVPFNQRQISKYVEKWFDGHIAQSKDNTVFANQFLIELHKRPQLYSLAQIPQFLSFLCELYSAQIHSLPADTYRLADRKVEIYQKTIKYLLGEWSPRRKSKSKWKMYPKIKLLEKLAYDFSIGNEEYFSSNDKQVLLGDELYNWIDKYLGNKHVPKDFKKLNPSKLLEELSEDDGILVKLDREEMDFIFAHRTLQEYLTASYLNEKIKKDQYEILSLLKNYFWDYEWHETISLLAGLMNDPISLIEAINEEKDDIFNTLLVLSGKCIAQCKEINHSAVIDKIDRLYALWKSNLLFDYINPILIALGRTNSVVIDKLCVHMQEANYYTIEKIIRTLGSIETDKTIQILFQCLTNKNTEIRDKAIISLGVVDCPRMANKLIDIFRNSDDSEMKTRLALILGYMGNENAVPPLIEALTDDDPFLRDNAANALGNLGSKEAVIPLIRYLKDVHPLLTYNVAYALGQIDGKTAIKLLIKELKTSKKFNVKLAATQALGEIGNISAVKPLIQALTYEGEFIKINIQNIPENPDGLQIKELSELYNKIRSNAADALGKIGKMNKDEPIIKDVIENLISFLNNSDDKIRIGVISALGNIGKKSYLMSLINALEDSDTYVRVSVVYALEQIRSVDANRALKEIAKSDTSSLVRRRAIDALSIINKSEAVSILIEGLKDGDDGVKSNSASELGRIGDSKSCEYLMDLLINGNGKPQIAAAEALARIGYVEAAKHMVKLLKNSERKFSQAIAQALVKIGSVKTIKELIKDPDIDIYDPYIFSLMRVLTVKYRKELPDDLFPLYSERLAKYKSTLEIQKSIA